MEPLSPRDIDDSTEFGTPPWMLTFIDLVSLLLTFFVLLFAMSSLKGEPWRATRATLTTVFGGHERLPQPATLRNEPWRRQPRGDDLDYLADIVTQALASQTLLSGIAVERGEDWLILRLPAALLFAPGSTAMASDGEAVIALLAPILAHVRNPLAVNGHTEPRAENDNAAARSWEMSLARAITVARALRRAGVNAPVSAHGFADSQYAALPGDWPQATRAAIARRVDLVISDKAAAGR